MAQCCDQNLVSLLFPFLGSSSSVLALFSPRWRFSGDMRKSPITYQKRGNLFSQINTSIVIECHGPNLHHRRPNPVITIIDLTNPGPSMEMGGRWGVNSQKSPPSGFRTWASIYTLAFMSFMLVKACQSK